MCLDEMIYREDNFDLETRHFASRHSSESRFTPQHLSDRLPGFNPYGNKTFNEGYSVCFS